MADAIAMARFLANPDQKTTPKPKRETPSPKRESMKRGKGPRKVSVSQQRDTDITTGIMAERIWRALLLQGFFACECNKVPGHEQRDCGITWDLLSEAIEEAHPHHHEKRRKGPKANRRNVSVSRSRPSNLFVIAPPCHDDIENNRPQFSRSRADA